MQDSIKSITQWTITALILFWLGWHLVIPIDFINSDLGRHIKNGELILQGQWDVLYKNYYTYTNPEHHFINQHWLFGVFCYAAWYYFGFTGLFLIYLILELFTFYLFFRCWQRYSSFAIACAFGLMSVPLVSFRSEIRPEGISCLFCGLFWWLIDTYQQKRLKPHHLITELCVIQIIWVNTHIFFIMGPILTAILWLQARSNREEEQADVLQKLFFLLLGMCLINPFGINGLLVPFCYMNKAYAYPIKEIQSVFSVLKTSPGSIYLYFLATAGMLVAALFFVVKREGFKKYIFIGSLTLILSLAAIKVNRMIGIFGFFWMPLSSYVYSRWIQPETARVRKSIEIGLVVLGIIVSVSVNFDWKQTRMLGIVPASNDAAQFFKNKQIPGVIFNDYDIGGYLIYHLSPGHKLFVDNQAEAFPEDFFKKTYIPMQTNDDLWHKADRKYHFNVIFFALERTEWASRFFLKRLKDHDWAVVFFDNKVIIFVRRNAQNAQLIKDNEIYFNMKK